MKRYLLFRFEKYYPSGGWADFVSDSDDFDEIKKIAAKSPARWQIVDITKSSEDDPIVDCVW